MKDHEIARPPRASAAAAKPAQRTQPAAPAQDDVQRFDAALEAHPHASPRADGQAGRLAAPPLGQSVCALASQWAQAAAFAPAQAYGAAGAPAPDQPEQSERAEAAAPQGQTGLTSGAAALPARHGGQQGEGGEGGEQNQHEQNQHEQHARVQRRPAPAAEQLPAGPFGLFGVLLSPTQVATPAAAPEAAPAALTPTLTAVAAVAERMLVAAAADAPEVRVMVRADVMPGVEIRVAREAGQLLVEFSVSNSASLGVLQSAGDRMASELTRRLRSSVVVRSSACASAEREEQAWLARWKRGEQ